MQVRVRIGARRGMWFGSAVRAGIAAPISGSAHISVHICEAIISAVQRGRIQLASNSRKERPDCLNTSPGRPECPLTLVYWQFRANRGLNVRIPGLCGFVVGPGMLLILAGRICRQIHYPTCSYM